MRAAPERRAPERSGAANAGRHAGARSRPAGRRRIRHMYKEWDCRPGWAAGGQATMAVCWSLSNIRRSARLGSARLGIADAKRALDVQSFVELSIAFFPSRRCNRKTARASTPHVLLSSLTMVTSSACTRGCGATLPGPASAPAFQAPPCPLPASRTAHRSHPRPTRAHRPRPRPGSGTHATLDCSIQLNYCKCVVFMP